MTDSFVKHRLFPLGALVLVLGLIAAALAVGEVSLRRSQKFANYYELNDEPWNPGHTKDVLVEPWLWINPKNESKLVKKEEYTQVFHFGPEGLPGKPLSIEKTKAHDRFIVVGDSFVQGFGDTENQGVVDRLAALLENRPHTSSSVELMNAGIGGSDPVYEFQFISRVLLKYNPDLLLLVINSSDVQDLIRRGGLDRFTPDGQLKSTAPWWAGIYNRSHLMRAFMTGIRGYDSDFNRIDERASKEQSATRDLIDAILSIHRLAKTNSFQLLVLMHPLQSELEAGRLSPALFHAQEALKAQGLNVVDLTPHFQKHITPHTENLYFWKKDGHYNPKGYAVFALAIEEVLQDLGYLH